MSKFLEEKQKLNERAWSRGYHLFPEILNHLRPQGLKVGVEIGVAFGGHSESILEHTTVKKLYGIDSYQHRIDDYEDGMNLDQPAFDLLHEQTLKRLSKFRDRFELIRVKSLEAVSLVSEPLDFVYIDAEHSCEGCLKDIITWFPKVRQGGVIGGHDYNSSVHPDVTVAVDQFFGHLGWPVNYEGHGCWWVEKQPLDAIGRIQLSSAQFWWKCCLSITRTLKGARRVLGRGKRFVLTVLSRLT